MLHRPYIRNATRQEVENRAEKNEKGQFLDANTGKAIESNYHIGHKYGHEFRYEKAEAEKQGLTQKEFNDRMNNPDLYQIEDPKSNMSHKFESPTNPYETQNTTNATETLANNNGNTVSGFTVTSVSTGENNASGETASIGESGSIGAAESNSPATGGESNSNTGASAGETSTGGESNTGGEEEGDAP